MFYYDWLEKEEQSKFKASRENSKNKSRNKPTRIKINNKEN